MCHLAAPKVNVAKKQFVSKNVIVYSTTCITMTITTPIIIMIISQQNVDVIFTSRMNKAAVTMCFMILTPTTAVIMG